MTNANSISTISNNQTMSSLEIAELVDSRHDKVKQSIERLVERGVIAQPPMGNVVKTSNGRKYETEIYLFSGVKGKRDSIVVVAQLSPEFTAKLVDRWEYLERKLENKKNFALSRKVSKDEYLPMTNAIKEAHEEIKPYHFSNEADLINRIVLGCSSSKYRKEHDIQKGEAIRDYLNQSEINCVIALQRANTVYIEDGLDFQERKEKLNLLFNRKHKHKIIGEIHRLNA